MDNKAVQIQFKNVSSDYEYLVLIMIYLDFTEVFDIVSHKILFSKLICTLYSNSASTVQETRLDHV